MLRRFLGRINRKQDTEYTIQNGGKQVKTKHEYSIFSLRASIEGLPVAVPATAKQFEKTNPILTAEDRKVAE